MTRQIALSVRRAGRPVRRLVRPLRAALSVGAGAHCDVVLEGEGVADDHLMIIPGGQGVRLAALGLASFMAGGRAMQMAAASDRGEVGIGDFTLAYRVIPNAPTVDPDAIDITPSSWHMRAPIEQPRAPDGPDATRQIGHDAIDALALGRDAVESLVDDDVTVTDLDPATIGALLGQQDGSALPDVDATMRVSGSRPRSVREPDPSSSGAAGFTEPTVNLGEDDLLFDGLPTGRHLPQVRGADAQRAGSSRQPSETEGWDGSTARAAEPADPSDETTSSQVGGVMWAPSQRPPRQFDVGLLEPTRTPDSVRNPLHPLMGVPRDGEEARVLPGDTARDGGSPTGWARATRRLPGDVTEAARGAAAGILGEPRPGGRDVALPGDTAPVGGASTDMPASDTPPRLLGPLERSRREPSLVAAPLLPPDSGQLPWSRAAAAPSHAPAGAWAGDEPVESTGEIAVPRLGPVAFALDLMRGPRARGMREWIGRILGFSLVAHLCVVGGLSMVEVPDRTLRRLEPSEVARMVVGITTFEPEPEPFMEPEPEPYVPPTRTPPEPPEPPSPIMELPPIVLDDVTSAPSTEDARRVLDVTNKVLGPSRLHAGPGDGVRRVRDAGSHDAIAGGIGSVYAPRRTKQAVDKPKISRGALGKPRKRKPVVEADDERAARRQLGEGPGAKARVKDKDGIKNVLRQRRRRFQACYENALQRSAGELGITRIELRFMIDAEGRASSVKAWAHGAALDARLERCLVRTIETATFVRHLREPVPYKYAFDVRAVD